jgi:hypothetical protein
VNPAVILSADPAETVDTYARVVGTIGAVAGLGSLFRSYLGFDRQTLWRRRYTTTQELAPSLDDVRKQVDPEASPQAALGLWSASVGVALEDIAAKRARIPYRRYRNLLEEIHTRVVRVRGIQAPTKEQMEAGDGMTLSPDQKKTLREASEFLAELEKLDQKVSKRGAPS